MAITRVDGTLSCMEPVDIVPAAPPRPEALLTAAEHDARRAELHTLRRRHELAELPDERAVLELRIARLEELLAQAAIVSDAEAGGVVTVGCIVEVEYVRIGRPAVLRVTVADAGPGCVSARSPVGQALMGRRPGDVVTAELPGGRLERLRIAGVRPGGDVPAAG